MLGHLCRDAVAAPVRVSWARERLGGPCPPAPSSLEASHSSACGLWPVRSARCLGPPPVTPPSRLVSQLCVSDHLGRHALCKQIIEKINPARAAWTFDLSCVILSSGFLLEIEEWLPKLSLAAAFNLATSHADRLPGCPGALDVTAAATAAAEIPPFPLPSSHPPPAPPAPPPFIFPPPPFCSWGQLSQWLVGPSR